MELRYIMKPVEIWQDYASIQKVLQQQVVIKSEEWEYLWWQDVPTVEIN